MERTHLEDLPVEIRSMIFGHVFEGVRIVLRKATARVPPSQDKKASDLSILFTCRAFNKDPNLRSLLMKQATLVIRDDKDWMHLVRRCFNSQGTKSINMIQERPIPQHLEWIQREANDSLPVDNWWKEVTTKRVQKILQKAKSLHVAFTWQTDWLKDDVDRLKLLNQDPTELDYLKYIGRDRSVLRTMRRCRGGVRYERIWSALRDVMAVPISDTTDTDSQTGPNLTFGLPMSFPHTRQHSGWICRTVDLVEDAIFRYKDMILYIACQGETYEIPQKWLNFDVEKCPRCGEFSCV